MRGEAHPIGQLETRCGPLSIPNTMLRLAMIGVVLVVVAGGFAYLGGWLTPRELTPARFVDGFEHVNGVQPGFRRNHAKGLGVSGFFESNGNGARLSKAVVFQPGRVQVFGRFSLAGGMPHVTDSAEAVRGLGLHFSLPDGEAWRTAMISLPVFPFRTPEAFYEQLLASKAEPATGKPDPAAMKAFLDRHPETAQVLGAIKSQPVASGFENTTFYGLNAFRFSNSSGQSTPVRWLLTPTQPFEKAGDAPAARLLLLRDVRGSRQRDSVSHADREGRNAAADGALEHRHVSGRAMRGKRSVVTSVSRLTSIAYRRTTAPRISTLRGGWAKAWKRDGGLAGGQSGFGDGGCDAHRADHGR